MRDLLIRAHINMGGGREMRTGVYSQEGPGDHLPDDPFRSISQSNFIETELEERRKRRENRKLKSV